MRLKPTEIKLIAALLDEPAEDAEELAGRILVALHEHRRDVKSYLAVVWSPSNQMFFAFGPYPGRRSALAELSKGLLYTTQGDRGIVVGLTRRDG